MILPPLYLYGITTDTATGIKNMDIDWIALVVAIGGVIGIWIKMEVSIKAIQVRQGVMEANLELLRTMVERQIEVDNGIKERLTTILVSQETLQGKIDTLSERIKRA